MKNTINGIMMILLLVTLPYQLVAQETEGPTEETEEVEVERENPLVASAWCTFVKEGDVEREEEEREGEEGGEEGEEVEPSEESLGIGDSGCDVGLGLSLYRINHLSFVGVLGTKSLGAGLAFVVKRSPTIAIAIGFVVPYDSSGIYSNPRLAIGATLNLKGD